MSTSLGMTTGLAAAGAWAARMEVASLLRVRSGELIRLIKSGTEGPHVLKMVHGAPSHGRESSAPKSWERVGDVAPGDLFDGHEDWDKEVEKQRAILDSLAGMKDERPPWAASSGSGDQSKVKRSDVFPPSVPEGGVPGEGKAEVPFQKKATPPPAMVKTEVSSVQPVRPIKEPMESERSKKEEGLAPFSKPANPPPRNQSRGRERSRRRRRKEAPTTMAEKESEALHKYQKECMYIYEAFKRLGFPMDLESMVEPSKVLDKDRFRLLTRPNRAATGLNYTRLMDRFLKWRRTRKDLDGVEGPLDARFGSLEFVEYLMQKQVGYLTPRSFLYAVDYFSTAFGFDPKGKCWHRAKRLALSFANKRANPVARAPCFMKATLLALEMAVEDGYLPKPARVACGKLRLCIQASTRYDDLLNTPLSECEWVRKPGERAVIGLRSRAIRGKSGPRLWVASLKGVKPEHDNWLVCLMRLLLESHGETWKQDDHLGKLALSLGGEFSKMPARLEVDVGLVKSTLEKYSKEGIETGLDDEATSVLRWHGAKATLSSIMQHLNLPKRVVRWQGNWSSQTETMPDTYLRESQTLVLASQEKCLEYLRQGGDLVRLIGEPVNPGKDPEHLADVARRERAMAATFGDGAKFEGLPKDVLDGAFSEDGAISEECLKQEAEAVSAKGSMSEFLQEDAGDNLAEDESASDPDDKEKSDVEAGAKPKDPVELMDEADTEMLTPVWIQAKTPGKAPKVHLPYPASGVGEGPQPALPKCGASGSFEIIKAEETLEASTKLCKRCCSSTEKGSNCEAICGHLHLSRNLTVYRCIRRCVSSDEGHNDHRCSFHVPGPKREGPN